MATYLRTYRNRDYVVCEATGKGKKGWTWATTDDKPLTDSVTYATRDAAEVAAEHALRQE
jgi:hypothetical protein